MRNKIVAVLFFALLSCVAFAQRSAIQGTITQDGKPLEGAEVLFQGDQESGAKYTLKTNKKGEFFSMGIRTGMYDVTISKDGKPLLRRQIQVSGDRNQNIFDMDLTKLIAEAQQQAQTQAAAPAQAQQAQGKAGAIDLCAPGTVLTDEQKKKLTPEQAKAFEECQRIHAANAKIGNVNVVLKQASAAAQAGNPDQAAQLVAPVTQSNPELALPWVQLGNYQMQSAKKLTDMAQKRQAYAQAAENMAKGIQVAESGTDMQAKKDLPKYRLLYGTALESAGKHDEAMKAFEQTARENTAAADQKGAAVAYFNAGAAATNGGKSDEAVAYFDKAIAADPTYAEAYYQKGIALMGKATTDKSGKFIAPEGTEQAFQKYLEMTPTGQNAEAAKAMLESMGSKVVTGYKKK
jgi:tetratricopeptide (TPR) repeat protein